MKDERTSTRTLSEYFETAGALFNGTNLELSTSRVYAVRLKGPVYEITYFGFLSVVYC